MGSGAAWGDSDGDGWLDLYVVNFAGALSRSPEEIAQSPASDRLYRNLGNGSFADVTETAGRRPHQPAVRRRHTDHAQPLLLRPGAQPTLP
jgi:hypothetical protein